MADSIHWKKMSIWGKLPLLLAALVAGVAAAAATSLAKPGCKESCWDLTSIPYPFGIGPNCYRDKTFAITCGNDTVRKAFMGESHVNVTSLIDVTSISLEDGEIDVMKYISYDCYDSSGQATRNDARISLPEGFYVSTKNKFTVVGCDTYAYFLTTNDSYSMGCISICNSPGVIPNGSCSGIGCCQTSIPKEVSFYKVTLRSFYNHTFIHDFNPCSYAFAVEEDKFDFSSDSFSELANVSALPLVLDWAIIGNVTCHDAKNQSGNSTEYACMENSECIDAQNGPGYRCSCSKGFQGNPYLPGGCKDINECLTDESNDCGNNSHCINNAGNYTCECAKGYHGVGGRNCTKDHLPVILIPICTAGGVTLFFLVITCFYFAREKRKIRKLKEKFFQQNGGLILQQKLSRHHLTKDTVRVFSADELKKATNNYDESRVIGKGGFGTVYKGILPNDTVVAIKKSKVIDQDQVEQFINELVVLSLINHRNVVKLLGFCLETQVPLLVYEFISNGTLFDHIHNQNKAALLSWETRVKIAAETAGVLSYLHSSANTPIIHRDMKPTNILLDDDYSAKVSDFGESRLVPQDVNELSTLVRGTIGYMDPEYFHTSQLTKKSDVYSFGVVLVELLTGRKALCFERPDKERSSAVCFLYSMEESRLFEVFDSRIVIEENNRDQIMDVAKLAVRCLRIKGEERPSMKEVAMELEGIIRSKMEKHPWENIDFYSEENKYFLGKNLSDYGHGGSSQSVAGYDSMKAQIGFPLGRGR